MSIQPLPQSTVRALGATQALTDPASLVKELLDNALDANANSVAVSISSNTLDVIQVRDNGHGIAPHDRPLVARRYCTSKICDDGDLKDIGGSSLGFRGEALASAAELSGTLSISTRIESEQIATLLNISQQGEVLSQERASLPVGTTVRITDFIKANPVRRQVALKNVDACLKKIKRLLQAYAFARPHVRLSLQVLKAKNKKGDWVYAPKPNGNAEDAAFKIVGAACASACVSSVVEDQGLTLQAFLPRPGASVSKISNIGSFVSIDARPVSSTRGLLKQITKVFRESLKSANIEFDGVKEPFLFLEISGGSYDANLEPAKDDVLFENADTVLHVVKQLFAAVYKPVAPSVVNAKEHVPGPITQATAEGERDDFPTSLEEESPTSPIHDGPASENGRRDATENWLESLDGQQRVRVPSTPALMPEPPARSNMYGVDEDDLSIYNDRPTSGLTEADFEELRRSRNDITLSNPWVLAKMNTSTRTPMSGAAYHSRSPVRPLITAADVTLESSPPRDQRGAGISGLPTPRPSSPSPPLETCHPLNHTSNLQIARTSRLIATSELPHPQGFTPVPSSGLHNVDKGIVNRDQHGASPTYPYALDRNGAEPAAGTRLADIPIASTRPRRAPIPRINKPFAPPSMDQVQSDQVWFDPPGSTRKSRTQRNRRDNSDSLVAQGEVGEPLEDVRPLTPPRRNRDIRDFVGRDASNSVSSMIERRNFTQTPQQPVTAGDEDSQGMSVESTRPVEASRQHRGFMPASELIGLEASPPHIEKQAPRASKRRKTTDRTPLRELSTNIAMQPAEAQDEVEYQPMTSKGSKGGPSRRRSSKGISRTKSSKLPLERVPPGQATHELTLNVSSSVEQLRGLASKIDRDVFLLSYHDSAKSGDSSFDAMEDPDVQALTANLHQLLITAGSETDVVDSTDLLEEVRAAVYAQRGIDSGSEMLMCSA